MTTNRKRGALFIGTLALVHTVFFHGAALLGQTTITPDCAPKTYTLTTTGATADVNNITTGCVTWTMEYQAVGFSAVSLAFQGAPAATLGGTPTAGTYTNWAGTVANGVNPVIVSPGAGATRFTDTSAPSVQGFFASFIRVNLLSITGTGSVTVTFYGYKAGNTGEAGGSVTAPCAGTTAAPCVVEGPAASGSPVSGNPVYIGGHNQSGNVQPVNVETVSGSVNAFFQQTGSDGVVNTALGAGLGGNVALLVETAEFGYNGTGWDRRRATSAANQSATINTGAQLSEKGPRWSLNISPGGGSQATVTKAAGGGTVRHIADCVIFSAGSITAPTLSFLSVVLRDGATGTGTVVSSWVTVVPAAAGENVAGQSLCGLAIVGSANTAMTLEFSGGITNLLETVTLVGYDVQ